MGIRGIIRDVLSIYLGFEILRGYLFKSFQINDAILIAALALFLLSIWFILERIGIAPRFS